MFFDLHFILGYALVVVVVVLSACDRVLAARFAAYGRPPASHHEPDRPITVPACLNRLYMFPDLRLYWNMYLLSWWLCLVPATELC
jgi:hypothetical protein